MYDIDKYFRYECALIRNWVEGIPIFPIFAADINGCDNMGLKFEKVNYGIEFPDAPHLRQSDAQRVIDKLRYK